jgi:hypothetical protein
LKEFGTLTFSVPALYKYDLSPPLFLLVRSTILCDLFYGMVDEIIAFEPSRYLFRKNSLVVDTEQM